MQDIHGILGGGTPNAGDGAPIFGDRRLRATAQGLPPHQQNLKCPRCDSSNTKFCYYNNYNLSQPRHFCKNCRRYWTNGGVLRNVPVGGGCRKTKRISKRKASSPSPSPAPPSQKPKSIAVNESENRSNSRSSSESTSANTATKDQSAGGLGKVAMVTESSSEFEQPTINYAIQEPTVNFTEIGGFSSFMSGNQSQSLFEFGSGGEIEPAPFRIHHQNQVNHQQENQQLMRNPTEENWRMEKLDGGDHDWEPGVLDQTIQVDLLPNSRSTDWNGGRSQFIGNLFDLTTPGSSAVHGGHWSGQSTDQWHESDRDHDHHLYLPP